MSIFSRIRARLVARDAERNPQWHTPPGNDVSVRLVVSGADIFTESLNAVRDSLQLLPTSTLIRDWDGTVGGADASVGALMIDLIEGAIEQDLSEMVALALVEQLPAVIAFRTREALGTYVVCPRCRGAARVKRPSESHTRKCPRCAATGQVAA